MKTKISTADAGVVVLLPAGVDRWIRVIPCDDAPGLYNAQAVGGGWPSTKNAGVAKLKGKGAHTPAHGFTAESVPLEVLLRRAAVWAGR